MASSIGFRILSYLPSCYSRYGAWTLTPVGLAPTDHASLRWTHAYRYKSGFNGRLGDLAVRPVCLQPLFANGAYTSMRMRNKSYADNSSLMTDSQVLQSPPAWASIIPPDCALVEFLSCAIRI